MPKGKPPATRIKKVSPAYWAAAIKILTGQTVSGKDLPRSVKIQLRENLRGPFAKGMDQQQAVKLLDAMGWRVQ